MPPMTAAPDPDGPGPGRSVAVIGEALVDVYPDGSQVPGGAPFNVARWLAAFGLPTLLITRIGQGDAAAACLQTELRRFGLQGPGVQIDAQRPTGLVQVLPAPEGHRFEIAPDSAWDHLDAAAAAPLLAAATPAIVCFGSLALRHPHSRAAITELVAAARPALRLVDLNLRDVPGLRALAAAALGMADWVKLNEDELRQVLAWFVGPQPAADALESPAAPASLAALASRFGLRRLIVTLGEHGWASFDAQGRRDAGGPAPPVPRLQDTVGAGDAFTAGVIAGLMQGRPLAEAGQTATELASAVCGWRGALPIDDAVVDGLRQRLGFDVMQCAPELRP